MPRSAPQPHELRLLRPASPASARPAAAYLAACATPRCQARGSSVPRLAAPVIYARTYTPGPAPRPASVSRRASGRLDGPAPMVIYTPRPAASTSLASASGGYASGCTVRAGRATACLPGGPHTAASSKDELLGTASSVSTAASAGGSNVNSQSSTPRTPPRPCPAPKAELAPPGVCTLAGTKTDPGWQNQDMYIYIYIYISV